MPQLPQPSLAAAPAPRFPLRSRLADRLRDLLRVEIVSGRWGRKLPSERRLAEEFRVGRPTLHTALRALERSGLISGGVGRRWGATACGIAKKPRRKRRDVVVFLRNPRTRPNLMPLLPLIDNLRQRLHKTG